ncbi:Retrovirus-related Pol polyprotein from type-1 retrotransposable element R1 [Araneus ventricosus]|uniref:Retrovirus-related Pol polyprotein from type-1 retrotransposable element R1 n=1 Tax=Araneus ventricosus TaxID=182803 RepID=A0A4Y2Q0E4_ARAVE|nr:Retrovirus-related Pol polyprotein from type-1 retrotransposable element R1 [Araneus ventricosus]
MLAESTNPLPPLLHHTNSLTRLLPKLSPSERSDRRAFLTMDEDGEEADKIKSYRPVTLLPTIGKVLEQILLRSLNHTLKKKNILHHNQFGSREGRSTDDAIYQLVEKIHDAKNKQLHTMVISLDIQGAFDHLQYNSISKSLDEINILSHTTETFKDILNDRKVTIQAAQGPVSWSQQQGCAQGSCTGPMYWSLVANEIISEEWQPNVHLQAFANDFIFVISEPTGAKLKATAQAALTKFQHWTDKHQLKVSTEKSTTILISRLVSGPRVKWGNQIIKRSTSLKYLGVIIDNKMNWADHLINMKTKLTHLHQKNHKNSRINLGT